MSTLKQESNTKDAVADALGEARLKEAYDAMVNGESFFLTGDAGTGKTTLIKKFIKEHGDHCVVIAPTGVAAVNAEGQTIHSFFSLPPRSVSWDSIKNLDNDPERKEFFKHIKTIIIDEASMVRADMVDTIFMFFEKNFKHDGPFGGRQIIWVGDLDQLPPVVASPEERQMIFERYNDNEFFFAAKCFKKAPLKTIKLTKVWRQSDPVFIDLLNRIKNNLITQTDIDFLNAKCLKEKLRIEDGMVLCATNETAQSVNIKMLHRLPGDILELKGTVSGKFNPKNCPVEETIYLKIGARIMTMKNDTQGRYVNGSMGTLVAIREVNDDDVLVVLMDGEDGEEVEINTAKFDSIKYNYDKKTDVIKSNIDGQFTQYPIKLCYAISIHKSQGKTFDKIIIDFGRGAFAHGMVYVALSRCRTLEGVSLRVPMRMKDLVYNNTILEFNESNA